MSDDDTCAQLMLWNRQGYHGGSPTAVQA